MTKDRNPRVWNDRLKVLVVSALFITVVLAIPAPSSAGVVEDHATRFEAVPAFVNLGMRPLIEVEIGTSYGAGLDNYRVTVTAPDGTEYSMMYEFTDVGVMNGTFGNESADFMAKVDQVGTYEMVLEYFDGTNYTVVGLSELRVTDVLLVWIQPMAAANTFVGPDVHAHTCPITNEYERGSGAMNRAKVSYLSNGHIIPIPGSVVTHDMPGHFKDVVMTRGNPLWHTYQRFAWDAPAGTFVGWVNATDEFGNHGSEKVSKMIVYPARLQMTVETFVDGEPSAVFEVGDTVTFDVNATYNDFGTTHNDEFHGGEVGSYAPLNATRGGSVALKLGTGYDGATGNFTTNITTLSLTLDTATQHWMGTYVVTSEIPDVMVIATSEDGANPPNTGHTFTKVAFVKPLVVEVDKWHNETITEDSGYPAALVGGAAIGVVLAAVGLLVMVRRRRD